MPKETLEGEARAEDAVPAIGSLVCGRQQGGGEEVPQVWLESGQGGLAEGLGGAAAEGSQPGTKSGEKRCLRSKYMYSLIDSGQLFGFNGVVKTTSRPPPQYRQLQRQLARLGYLSQGSVFERAPGQQGSRYVWTRKVKAKTVTVALSPEQYQWFRQAVANQRELERIIRRMQILSRQILFETVPGVVRRKHLGKKVLGLN